VEGDGEACLSVIKEVVEAFVGLLRSSQSREHSHRPESSSIHGGLDPSGKWVESWETDISRVIQIFDIFRGVEALDLEVGDRGESGKSFRFLAEDLGEFFTPFLLLLF